MAACKPAPFRRGQEEVLDPTYRDAVQMDASQFTTSLRVAELPILSEIQSYLAPDTQDIRARLYKLNVYGPGGFFKAHRDTPRGTQMFGSLVVCLPTAFEGGEFVMKNDDGVEQRFAWCDNPEQVVQWCAFYSDCKHEVLPVTYGQRLTLTYLLEGVKEPSDDSSENDGGDKDGCVDGVDANIDADNDESIGPGASAIEDAKSTTSSLANKLEEALSDSDFAPKGVKLGFGLSHGYVVGNKGKIPMLKGPDRVLEETLDLLGLKYAFVPVYRSKRYDYKQLSSPEGSRKRKYCAFEGWGQKNYDRLEEWVFKDIQCSARDGIWNGDNVQELFVSTWDNYAAGAIDGAPDECEMIDYLDPSGLGLKTSREVVWIAPPRTFPYEEIGAAYGNNPSVESYYAAACFLVWVPPYRGRAEH
ncbi:hypothetical protein Poli38472_011585 [Pythium oligandrum]|uniref:Fe2OG dioxygenase domain-containing protein n=1 Tax=Pythium oligandrum TaxID=41045 RepID=A0A8K1CK29_PYTOL|nr:hypothetical protein Poli38472_011585 [Pythium oligandrum]|eukprot:TMW64705.1 hypothetical protein Poli38472_011585 [Pythium oligandrum]